MTVNIVVIIIYLPNNIKISSLFKNKIDNLIF